MWCRTCQQDVPAVSSEAGGAVVCCARCGEPFEPVSGTYIASLDDQLVARRLTELASESADDESIAKWLGNRTAPVDSTSVAPEAVEAVARPTASADVGGHGDLDDVDLPDFFEVDDWELDEDLRRVEHVLQRFRNSMHDANRVDSATAESVPAWHVGAADQRGARRSGGIQLLSWLTLAMGMVAFVCGGVLMFAAVWQNRPNLWPFALPAALVGQLLLILGVVGLFDTAWRQQRSGGVAPRDIERELSELAQLRARLDASGHAQRGRSRRGGMRVE